MGQPRGGVRKVLDFVTPARYLKPQFPQELENFQSDWPLI